ncbi:AI-2E family transporter [Rhizobium sp. NRK18]|uniref:AI-2E family transporter n=1 Tax=Rhizobium sp. NRK18 TaxID=2964667 RepID=UPI0021C36341|nr:AI-2E family transporter [Rhizobium sp. NRK18]MCQ2002608.1 AI-2E family transporter [Rhizobium sp. NRK18]
MITVRRSNYSHKRINLDSLLNLLARLSLIVLALFACIAAMDYAQVIIAPVVLAIVIGLMLAPLGLRLERIGCSPWLSSGVVVLALLILIMGTIIAFSVPISAWVDKAPEIWQSLQLRISDWRSTISSLNAFWERLGQVAGDASKMKVSVDGNSGVETVITLAPAYVAEIILFLLSLYFFLATRDNFRVLVLSLCITRPLRWRAARIFRDAERLMSRYLLSISIVNIGLGIVVGLALWLIGVPSAFLWGMLAAVLNYVVYVGPALMTVILLAVALATNDTMGATLLPPFVYLSINFIESQFVTPRVLGSSVTLNPFLIFLALTFWLWLWGPIGGFIAVPSLLICSAILTNIIPTLAIGEPTSPRRNP